MFLLCWGAQCWSQHSLCGLTNAEGRGRITSLSLLVTLLLMQPKMLLAVWVDIFSHKGTLLAYVQLGVHQEPQVLFCQATFGLGGPQHVLMHGVVGYQVKDCALFC